MARRLLSLFVSAAAVFVISAGCGCAPAGDVALVTVEMARRGQQESGLPELTGENSLFILTVKGRGMTEKMFSFPPGLSKSITVESGRGRTFRIDGFVKDATESKNWAIEGEKTVDLTGEKITVNISTDWMKRGSLVVRVMTPAGGEAPGASVEVRDAQGVPDSSGKEQPGFSFAVLDTGGGFFSVDSIPVRRSFKVKGGYLNGGLTVEKEAMLEEEAGQVTVDVEVVPPSGFDGTYRGSLAGLAGEVTFELHRILTEDLSGRVSTSGGELAYEELKVESVSKEKRTFGASVEPSGGVKVILSGEFGEDYKVLTGSFTASSGPLAGVNFQAGVVSGDEIDPVVKIVSPLHGALLGARDVDAEGKVEIEGEVDDTTAEVTVNEVPVTLDEKGKFGVKVKLSEGLNTISAVAVDSNGNVGKDEVQVTLDTQPPTDAEIVIDEGEYTNEREISLTLSAIDANGMAVKEAADCEGIEGFEVYQAQVSFALSEGDGLKTICGHFQDQAGNVSDCACDSITLDTVAPAVSFIEPQNNARLECSSDLDPNSPFLQLAVVVQVDGVEEGTRVEFREEPDNQTSGANVVTGRASTFLTLTRKPHRITARTRDEAGNSGETQVLVENRCNNPPQADAGPDKEAAVATAVVLQGSGADADNDQPLAYRWELVSKPDGSAAAVSVSGSSGENAEITPDVLGSYELCLTVSDKTSGDRFDDPAHLGADTAIVTTPPFVDSFTPQPAAPGFEVVITGQNFNDADEADNSFYFTGERGWLPARLLDVAASAMEGYYDASVIVPVGALGGPVKGKNKGGERESSISFEVEPYAPGYVSPLASVAGASDVRLWRSFAIVAGTGQVSIFDVSIPSSPQALQPISGFAGDAVRLSVGDGTIYIRAEDGSTGARSIEIADILTATLQGEVAGGLCAAEENPASYVGIGGGLLVYETGDWSGTKGGGATSTGSAVTSVQIAMNRAFAGTSDGRVESFNVVIPFQPAVPNEGGYSLGADATSGDPRAVAALARSSGNLFVVAGDGVRNTLHVLDASVKAPNSEPAAVFGPAWLKLTSVAYSAGFIHAGALFLKQSDVAGSPLIIVLDASQPQSPQPYCGVTIEGSGEPRADAAVSLGFATAGDGMQVYSLAAVKSPIVAGADPQNGATGDVIQVYGFNFAADPASNAVTFGGTAADVTASEEGGTVLTVEVPDVAEGVCKLRVEVDGAGSNEIDFPVLPPGGEQP